MRTAKATRRLRALFRRLDALAPLPLDVATDWEKRERLQVAARLRAVYVQFKRAQCAGVVRTFERRRDARLLEQLRGACRL